MRRRSFLASGLLGLGTLATSRHLTLGQAPAAAGELLYNGIRLPTPWLPKTTDVPKEPQTPPYLVTPPSVIPIDVGRQLFVDDFLIEKSTLQRTYHRAEYHPANPILKPEKPWEQGNSNTPPCAMVFSDGVWFDPQDKIFKMWYMGGVGRPTCHATSEDGLTWKRPMLDVKPDTNIVQTGPRDSSTIWLDHAETDPKKRWKMFRSCSGGSTVKGAYGLATFFSPDGIHWNDQPLLTGSCGDRSTVFWNPFRMVWVYSLRHGWGTPRRRRYWETPDLVNGPKWEAGGQAPMWIGSDTLDPQREDLKIKPELYNLDCVAYESLIIGLFTIWRGQPEKREKPNEICVGFSRDGWHWSRPGRRAFCPVSEKPGDWNFSNVQSAGGCCLVMGDKLWFFVSGRGGTGETRLAGQSCVTSLATLRRDGFASLDAAAELGELTTRPVQFSGKHLFVNAATAGGELRVEVLDREGQVVAPFSRENCVPVTVDSTVKAVEWKGGSDLTAVAGKPVRLRFHLKSGNLYSFWVSPEANGASRGYVAAGGPHYTGAMDTVGVAASRR